jgi:hypothetical protein
VSSPRRTYLRNQYEQNSQHGSQLARPPKFFPSANTCEERLSCVRSCSPTCSRPLQGATCELARKCVEMRGNSLYRLNVFDAESSRPLEFLPASRLPVCLCMRDVVAYITPAAPRHRRHPRRHPRSHPRRHPRRAGLAPRETCYTNLAKRFEAAVLPIIKEALPRARVEKVEAPIRSPRPRAVRLGQASALPSQRERENRSVQSKTKPLSRLLTKARLSYDIIIVSFMGASGLRWDWRGRKPQIYKDRMVRYSIMPLIRTVRYLTGHTSDAKLAMLSAPNLRS